MNKYREILFQHLDGIVLIPTLTGLYKSGILDLIIEKQKFSIMELSKHKKLNPSICISHLIKLDDLPKTIKSMYYKKFPFIKIVVKN